MSHSKGLTVFLTTPKHSISHKAMAHLSTMNQRTRTNSPMDTSAVLLDLDGTLLDSLPDLAHAINGMRADLALPALGTERIGTYIGKGAAVLVQRALADVPKQNHEQAMALFRRHYHACNGRYAIPYPGALEGLARMRDMGLKLAIVTNKPEQFTLPLLERSRIAPYVEVVVSGDTCAHAKPHPEPLLYACKLLGVTPAQAIMIGDSINDAQAARAAGMPVLVVPYGYNEGLDVRSLEVDAIVTSILDAAEWLAAR